MTDFVVVGSGVVNLSNQVFTGFSGISFQTNGNLKVILKDTQFAPLALPSDCGFTGSGFKDTVEIGISPGATFVGSSFTLSNWQNADRFIFYSSTAGENITGTQGNDTFYLSAGNDTIDGNLGSDDLLVIDYSETTGSFAMATGNVGIGNSAGTHVTFANIDRFNVKLGSGNDTIVLGNGNDRIDGGAGDDSLDTGTGAAVVDGGAGNDLWISDFSGDAAAKTINLNLAGIQSAGNGTTYVNVERLNFTGGAGNDAIVTRTGNPNDGLADTLNGGGGNDTLTVGGGNDVVNGGDGDDLLIVDYSGDSSSFAMGAGNALISDSGGTSVSFVNIERIDVKLGSGNDTIVLGNGNDRIDGGAGDDSLDTGTGAAVVDGGAGNDLWISDFSGDAAAKTINLNLAGIQSAGNGTTYVNVERLNFTGGAGNDAIVTRTGNPNDGLADTLNGGGGNDRLTVGGGNDVVNGGDGDDLLIVDYSGDNGSFAMGAGNALISDSGGTSVSFVNIERFNVKLGLGSDTVVLGNGNDRIKGEAGDDKLTGAGGHDVMTGGAGNDTFVFNAIADSTVAKAGRDQILDYDTNGDQIDLRAIDAIAGGGDDGFSFVGGGTFTGLGQIRVYDNGVNTFIDANTHGGLAADMRIVLKGVVALDAGDFLL